MSVIDVLGWFLVLIGAQILFDAFDLTATSLFLAKIVYLQICLGLLLLPGYAAFLVLPASWLGDDRGALAIVPVFGFLLLCAYGLLLWLLQLGEIPLYGMAFRYSVTAASLAIVWARRTKLRFESSWRLPLTLYALVVLGAVAYSAPSINVDHESFPHTHWEGRMPASPPDNAIPFQTGVFFLHGHSGKSKAPAYFGTWSVTSRGPLLGLMDAAMLNAMGFRPHDPPANLKVSASDTEGYYIARVNGIVTNALIILAAASLLFRLNATPDGVRFGLLWLAVSPLAFINVGFTWPKLLAGYFAILTATEILDERRHARIALWAALSYLSHPVGALFVPAFVVVQAYRAAGHHPVRQAATFLRAATVQCAWLIAFLLPWLLYKVYLHQDDQFMRYVLGDGRGEVRAASLLSWLSCRYDNITYTLVPFQYWFSHNLHQWLNTPVSEPVRWAVQNAKTLPGHLGFGLLGLYYNPRRIAGHATNSRCILAVLLFGTFAAMVVYNGFAADGLGRNTLEPLSVLFLLYIASQVSRMTRLLWAGLLVVAFETVYVAVIPVL